MADDFDKNSVNPSEKSKEESDDNKDILVWFKDNLQHLAQDVYDQSKDTLDNALKSLKNWLSLQEDSVQKETINELSQLRSSIEKVRKWDDVVSSVDVPVPHADSFKRSPAAQKGIEKSYKNIENMIAAASDDKNPIAAVLGLWMQKILDTES